MWCLGNIATDSVEFRDQIIDKGLIPMIVELLKVENLSTKLMETITWSLTTLSKGKPDPHISYVTVILIRFILF